MCQHFQGSKPRAQRNRRNRHVPGLRERGATASAEVSGASDALNGATRPGRSGGAGQPVGGLKIGGGATVVDPG